MTASQHPYQGCNGHSRVMCHVSRVTTHRSLSPEAALAKC